MKVTETTVPRERTFTLEVNENELQYIWYWATRTGYTPSARLDRAIKKLLPDITYNSSFTECFVDA